ncbi:MAG: hypothetical protein R3D70_20550 [Rhizobiaceae bacterium]
MTGKIIATQYMSLDGVIEDPVGKEGAVWVTGRVRSAGVRSAISSRQMNCAPPML